MNVLLVEDNEADAKIVREAFKVSCGADVALTTAADGDQALSFISGPDAGSVPRPDLILLDLNLPGKNGREVLRELKSNPASRKIPVVILTSSTFQGDICECYDLGANSFINKPMRFNDFVSLIKLFCDFWIREARYCRSF